MARIPNIKRIRKEDFKSEYQDLIDRVAFSVNSFMEETIAALSGRLNFDNINQQLVTYEISIDGSGNIVNPPNIRINLTSKPFGILCINAVNKNSPLTYPTSQPFVSYDILTNNLIKVNNISGLQNDSTYILTLLIIGN